MSADGTPQIKSLTKVSNPMMNNYSKRNKGGKSPGGGGKKGGGGGKSYKNDAKPKKEKAPEKRYENIDSAISSLTTTLDKLNKAEDDAWGATKIRNLRAVNLEISKQNGLLSERLREAKAYYDSDWLNVTTNAAINAAGFNATNITRNKDGSISNIEQLKKALWESTIGAAQAKENSLIGSTNEDEVKAAQQASEDAKEAYDEAIEALDKLQDSVEQYKDTLERMVDNIREMMSNILSEIQYRMDFKIGIKERDMRRLEKLVDRWGEIGILNGETDKAILREQKNLIDQMDITV